MGTLKLKNGKTINVIEDTIKGMAGESMYVVLFKNENGKLVTYDEIKPQLTEKDTQELELYLNELDEANVAEAHSFCY